MQLKKRTELQKEDLIHRHTARKYVEEWKYVLFELRYNGKNIERYVKKTELEEYLKWEASRQLVDSMFITKE